MASPWSEELRRYEVGSTGQAVASNVGLAKSRVVVGGEDGHVEWLEVTRSEATSVTRQKLEGAEGAAALVARGDKVFVAQGSRVVGLSKKKQFFRLETSLGENIRHIAVDGKHLVVCGEYMILRYDDGIDAGCFVCDDKVGGLCLGSLGGVVGLAACRDRRLRLVEGSELKYATRTDVVVCAMAAVQRDDHIDLYYGSECGGVGVLAVRADGADCAWRSQGRVRVTCVAVLGSEDLVCGRADGRVQVYRDRSVALEASVESAVQGIACGPIVGDADIVCCTFAGTLTLWATAEAAKGDETDEAASPRHKADAAKKLRRTSTQKRATSGDAMKEIRADLRLDAGNGCYVLTIQVSVPIDRLLLKSSVRLDVLDDVVGAVASVVERPDDDSAWLRIFRCQEQMNAVTLRLRTVEGEPGTLTALVVGRLDEGHKSARKASFDILPLSLHARVDDDHPPTNASSLSFKGDFSAHVFHDWLASAFPDVPARSPGGVARLAFENVVTGGRLDCDYQDGSAVIASTSLSALAIFKDHVAKAAVKKRVLIQDAVQIDETTVPFFLSLLDPKLRALTTLVQNAALLDALADVDASGLTVSNAKLVASAPTIRSQLPQAQADLAYLTGIVSDLFVDARHLAGQDARSQLPQLLRLLEARDLAALPAFFAAC